MSANTAELTLIIKAQNLAESALTGVRTSLGKVATTARTVAGDIRKSFSGLGSLLASQFVNVIGDLLTGGKHLEADAVALGLTLTGGIVEGLSMSLVPMIIERALSSAALAPLVAALTTGGVTLGTVISTAIAVGMAAFPFVLLAAAVAALVYLATNPEARQKAHDVAMMVLGKIGDGLRALPKILGDIFGLALRVVGGIVATGINTVVSFFLSIPSRVAGLWDQVQYNIKLNFFRIYYAVKKIVGQIIDAILGIPKAVGDALGSIVSLGNTTFHVSTGRTPRAPSRHAAGGWAGLNGPELSWLGEKGPEYVVPNHKLNTMSPAVSGVTITGVSEREILDMVDRGLYFRLQRAAPTLGKV